MNRKEQKRGDGYTVEAVDDKHIQCQEASKMFEFNASLDEGNLQDDVFGK